MFLKLFKRKFKLGMSSDKKNYLVLCRKWYTPFWKTVCLPVDEFDEEPIRFEKWTDAYGLLISLENGALKKYLLR